MTIFNTSNLRIPAATLINFCQRSVGGIERTVLISGGLVHFVFKVEGISNQAYLKVRSNSFSSNKDLIVNPDDMVYEKMGLKFFNRVCPGIFPQLLKYSDIHHLLLLENLFPYGGCSLKRLFERQVIATPAVYQIGRKLAYVMQQSANNSHHMGQVFPEERYHSNLAYRIGFINNTAADQIIQDLYHEPRQVICGDLSPKNIAVLPNDHIRFFDLDMVHFGNKVFDVGFLAGHLILETFGYGERVSKEVLINFIRGYNSYLKDKVFESPLTVKIALATILYRLNNSVIPYPSHLSMDSKQRIVDNSLRLLQHVKSWDQLLAA